MLVLVASLVAAVALLAQPVSAALSGTGGLRIGIAHELQLHPRIAAVAALLVVWSSAWGVYSGVTGAGRLNNNLASIGAPGSSVPGYSPDNGSTSTAAPGTSGSASGGASVSGGGGGGTINGAPVGAAAFQGANTPAVPSANYYSGQDNTVGITNTTIQMCAHAALTFGPAFNIGPGDLNVFWQMVDDPSLDPYAHTSGQAGIYNRQIVEPGGSPGIPIQDDGYQPSKAVQAATACQQQSGGDFFLLSGIGFDQIPAVRNWAEQNHMLYIHHIATAQGTGGLQFSFTMLPTLEQVGTQFGQYYTHHMNGQKIAIIERNSSNWAPGVRTFKSVLAAAGESGNITTDDSVTNNQGDYSKEIADFCVQHQSQAVFIWENALAADQIIQQTNQQTGGQCKPNWLLFPFNLTLQTLNQSGVDTSTMQGMVPWPAYTCASQRPSNYFAGNSAYQQEVAQFEAMYAKFDSGANLCGFGGDLLFGTWEAWKQVADLLVQCGPSCTRNNIAGLMLSGYKATVGSNCPVDFSAGDHHHGGTGEDLYLTEPGGNGRIWYNTGFCEVNVT